ncbi:GNAT family N-acetyltransferase [Proteus alimentorum]|uniref:GNAT family N-acetyltransferase n=1 Tax=Proteus alimentorum TaxID=1973495 RepID=A0ABS0IUH4_9GAMM|nr:GNAT family N-acetyltransferase [Proteus alimentorum]MBG2874395.1 GNAT family N-acetyltransferase [Proteus alimentorum]MBG2879674.1 GNAT family N-acetyltransferase [Proteus alimentorum]
MLTVIKTEPSHYDEMIAVWESSVRATHTFLSEDIILSLKKDIVEQYFPMLNTYIAIDNNNVIHGILGTAENKLEMLFVDANSRGHGCGKLLTTFAINTLHIDELDVNEQNPQAIGFYLYIGFEQIGRSELDGQGNPFPLLHLRLNKNKYKY